VVHTTEFVGRLRQGRRRLPLSVVIGCEDGVLIYKDGAITKVDSPTDYGRIGNQAGSEKSPIVLGDYKKDAEAELERPEQVSRDRTSSGSVGIFAVAAC
jgi:hypothetical protein